MGAPSVPEVMLAADAGLPSFLLLLRGLATAPVRGRDKKRLGEQWTLARVLLALLEAETEDGPFALVHRDRPDFALHVDKRVIGIEVTRAITQNLAHAFARCEESFDLSIPELRLGADALTRADLDAALKKRGEGWVDNEVEWEVLGAVEESIRSKMDSQWIGDFDERWLFIYEDMGLPGVQHDVVAVPLAQVPRGPFSRIFVLSNDRVLKHGPTGVRLLSVPRLETREEGAADVT